MSSEDADTNFPSTAKSGLKISLNQYFRMDYVHHVQFMLLGRLQFPRKVVHWIATFYNCHKGLYFVRRRIGYVFGTTSGACGGGFPYSECSVSLSPFCNVPVGTLSHMTLSVYAMGVSSVLDGDDGE